MYNDVYGFVGLSHSGLVPNVAYMSVAWLVFPPLAKFGLSPDLLKWIPTGTQLKLQLDVVPFWKIKLKASLEFTTKSSSVLGIYFLFKSTKKSSTPSPWFTGRCLCKVSPWHQAPPAVGPVGGGGNGDNLGEAMVITDQTLVPEQNACLKKC